MSLWKQSESGGFTQESLWNDQEKGHLYKDVPNRAPTALVLGCGWTDRSQCRV